MTWRAYIAQRRLVYGHRLLAFLATAPLGIPGIVLGIGVFAAYSHRPLLLYGTLWIFFVAYLTKFLPLSFQTCNAAIINIHPELEESSRILGAGRMRTFIDVTIPLFRAGLVAAWLLVFIPLLAELSASALLWTSNTKVVAVVILDLYEEGRLADISALGVVLMAVTSVALVVGFRFAGRDFMKYS